MMRVSKDNRICVYCGTIFVIKREDTKGRRKLYCTQTCKKKTYVILRRLRNVEKRYKEHRLKRARKTLEVSDHTPYTPRIGDAL